MPLDSTPVYCNLSFAVCAAGRTKGILNKAVGAALLDKIYVITPILNYPRVSYAFQKLFKKTKNIQGLLTAFITG